MLHDITPFRMLTAFLSELDAPMGDDGGVFVLATCLALPAIHPALLRSGRLEQVWCGVCCMDVMSR